MNIDSSYDIRLDVPYYRQNDPNGGLTEYWQKRSCGVLALKMVLDYWGLKAGHDEIPVTELFDNAMANGGVDAENNWLHGALVKTATQYGYVSWRRMWSLSADQKRGAAASGVEGDALERNQEQQRREALPSIVDALDHGRPVIVSVAKNFDDVDKPHLIVLTGIKRKLKLGAYEGIYYNDPYSPTVKDEKERYVDIDVFNDKWNFLAIFVEPKET